MIRSEKRALYRARAAEHVKSRRKVTSNNIFAGRTPVADARDTWKNRRSRDRAVTAIANSHRDSEYAVTLFNVIGGTSG